MKSKSSSTSSSSSTLSTAAAAATASASASAWLRKYTISPGTISLGLVAITHTYLLFHCSSYIGYMAVTLLTPSSSSSSSGSSSTSSSSISNSNSNIRSMDVVITVDNVGWYAGWLGTAFTFGRCLSFIPWKLARHSKPRATLLLSLALSTICSLWFGLSTTFWSAILSRFCLGLSNTLSACVRRIAIDRAKQAAIETARRHTTPARQKKTTKDDGAEKNVNNKGNGTIGDEDNNPDQKQEHNDEDEEEDLVQRHEELAPSKVLGLMWYGSVVGPVIGGWLSNRGTFEKDTILPDEIDHKYPFFLPNLIGALFCFVSMVGVWAFVDGDVVVEQSTTIEESQAVATTTAAAASYAEGDSTKKKKNDDDDDENTPLLLQRSFRDSNVGIESDGIESLLPLTTRLRSFWDVQVGDDVKALRLIWKTKDARQHLIAYWIFSFVVVCIDEGLAFWLIARVSGPGLSPLVIGWMFSLGAVQALLRHTFEVDRIVANEGSVSSGRFGIYPSLRIASILANVPAALVAFMMVINGGTYYDLIGSSASTVVNDQDGMEDFGEPGRINIWSFIFMVFLIGFRGTFSTMYFALIGVASGRTVPYSYRDHMASVATLGALCARALAPAVAGCIVASFMATDDGNDAVYLWFVFGLALGLGAASFTIRLSQPGSSASSTGIDDDELGRRRRLYLNARQKARAFANLWEVHWDKGSKTTASKWRRIARKVITMNRIQNVGNSKKSEEIAVPPIPAGKPINRRGSWSNHFLTPGIDFDSVPFFILGLKKGDKSYRPNVLTPALMGVLQNELPIAHRCDNFFLKFSAVRDGFSFAMLEARIFMIPNTIIAIETLTGEVFGCFMTKSWKRTNRYEMSGESFLWRLKQPRIVLAEEIDSEEFQDASLLEETVKREEDIEVYHWTGETEECQLFGDDRLAAGGGMVDNKGGFGFIMEGDLSSGTSAPCLAYGNPCLVNARSGRFEVANFEVWTMTPYLLQNDAEKAEKSIKFIHDNLVSPTGDKPSAKSSNWTNFL